MRRISRCRNPIVRNCIPELDAQSVRTQGAQPRPIRTFIDCCDRESSLRVDRHIFESTQTGSPVSDLGGNCPCRVALQLYLRQDSGRSWHGCRIFGDHADLWSRRWILAFCQVPGFVALRPVI